MVERKKELRDDVNTHHEYGNDFLDSDKVANICFTSDVDAKDRVIRGLNEYNKSNLNEMRTKNMRQDDGFFNITQNSDHDVDNDVVSIDIDIDIDSSQMDSMETHMMRMMADG